MPADPKTDFPEEGTGRNRKRKARKDPPGTPRGKGEPGNEKKGDCVSMKAMIKKYLSLLLALMLVGSMIPAGLAAENAAENTEEIQYPDELIVGHPTITKGDFFTEMFGNDTADIDVRALIHGYNLVNWDQNQGVYLIDESVVENVLVMEDDLGDKTYYLGLYEDLCYSDGTPITAWDYAFSILLMMSREIDEIGGKIYRSEHIMGSGEYLRGELPYLAGVGVLDDHQLAITLDHNFLPYFFETGLLLCVPYPISEIAPGCKVYAGQAVEDGGEYGFGIRIGNADETVTEPIFTADLLRKTILDPETGYNSHPKVVSGPYRLLDWDGVTGHFEINEYFKGAWVYNTLPEDFNFDVKDLAGTGSGALTHDRHDGPNIYKVDRKDEEGKDNPLYLVKPTISKIAFTVADNDTMAQDLLDGKLHLVNKVVYGPTIKAILGDGGTLEPVDDAAEEDGGELPLDEPAAEDAAAAEDAGAAAEEAPETEDADDDALFGGDEEESAAAADPGEGEDAETVPDPGEGAPDPGSGALEPGYGAGDPGSGTGEKEVKRTPGEGSGTGEGGIKYQNYPRIGLSFVTFTYENPTVHDMEVRQAMAWCMDREQLTQDYCGEYGMVVNGYYGIEQWEYLLCTDQLAYPVNFENDVVLTPEEVEERAKHKNRYATTEAEFEMMTAAWQMLNLDNLVNYNVYDLENDPERTEKVGIEKAKALLDDADWTLNRDGEAFRPGVDDVRCKMVDDQLVALDLTMMYPRGNHIVDTLQENWLDNLAEVGIRVTLVPEDMEELLKSYYREKDRTTDMIYLATNFHVIVDPSITYSTDPTADHKIWNNTYSDDEDLWYRAVNMRQTDPEDIYDYVVKWISFQERYNEVLPTIPLYSNVYFDFLVPTLQNYHVTGHVTWSQAILESYFGETPEGEAEDDTFDLEGEAGEELSLEGEDESEELSLGD